MSEGKIKKVLKKAIAKQIVFCLAIACLIARVYAFHEKGFFMEEQPAGVYLMEPM